MAVDDNVDPMALHDLFDDHPSLSASLEDFEHHGASSDQARSPALNIASHHSGFYRSDDGEDLSLHSDSGSAFSPPAERRPIARSASMAWSTHRPYQQEPLSRSLLGSRLSLKRSREPSPQYEQYEQYESAPEDNAAVAAKVRLATDSPVKSPTKPSPSPSPDPCPDRDRAFGDGLGRTRTGTGTRTDSKTEPVPESPNSYIRFAVRAEMQHRTEPYGPAVNYARRKYANITRSRTSTLLALLTVFLSISFLRILIQPPPPPPVPDLVKVAGLAKSFEPLIFYSENGVQQVGDLQETGVAVWDLGESLRTSNMTSAPLIASELDGLSENLKTLAMELTKFFANVDGDVDGILIVMEWAKRELAQVSSKPHNPLTSAMDNFHSVLCRVGLLESANGEPTGVGQVVVDLFGQTYPQRTRRTLQRTFNEFLAVLEESINTELGYSTAIFAIFESIDRQFLNLARTVIRESDQQEREEGELLSSLWTRVLGPSAAQLRKYEKNRLLLSNIREKTVRNKHLLVDHNGKLLSLKANLEILRKRLVSPLVRRNDSSTLSVEDQIQGLDGTYQQLRTARERQKAKMMEMIYGIGNRRVTLTREEEMLEIGGVKRRR